MNLKNNIHSIPAKSTGYSLIDHTKDVVRVGLKLSYIYKIPYDIIKKGCVLHDAGKAHPNWQYNMKNGNYKNLIRHELASLLLLPFFDRKDWDLLIEMVVSHHKATNNNRRGIIKLLGFDRDFDTDSDHYAMLIKDYDKYIEDAIPFLKYFFKKGNSFTIEDSKKALEYTYNYCKNADYGYSIYRGILNIADYMASGQEYSIRDGIKWYFKKPKTNFYRSKSRKNPLYPLSTESYRLPQKHTLVISPTGSGKTDYLLNRCKNRIFYTLPFQASINNMYFRFKDTIDGSIAPVHASSKMVDKESIINQEAFGVSIKVLTPYQLMSIVYGGHGFEALILDLIGQDVVLDEVHVFKGIKNSFIIGLIKILNLIGCNIHIGSATIPSVLKNEIIDILDKDDVHVIEKTGENRHNIIKLRNRHEFDIERYYNENKKILVICNTINRAQEMYNELSSRFEGVVLLHSRFKRIDRMHKEKQLMHPNTRILVSTQVVEVSIDINYDVMLTECAPLDSLIQRFGRINRKKPVTELKNIYVYMPEKHHPYSIDLIKNTWDILPEGEFDETTTTQLLDLIYTSNETANIDSSFIYNFDENIYTIKKLQNSTINYNEFLDINGESVIFESDLEIYKKNRDRQLQIPVPLYYILNSQHKFISMEPDTETGFYVLRDIYSNEYDENFGLITNPDLLLNPGVFL